MGSWDGKHTVTSNLSLAVRTSLVSKGEEELEVHQSSR